TCAQRPRGRRDGVVVAIVVNASLHDAARIDAEAAPRAGHRPVGPRERIRRVGRAVAPAIAPEQTLVRSDDVIDADAPLVTDDVVWLTDEVIAQRIVVRQVRERDRVEDGGSERRESLRRDDVVRERLSRQRVVDDGAGKQRREIAAAERLFWHAGERLVDLVQPVALVVYA